MSLYILIFVIFYITNANALPKNVLDIADAKLTLVELVHKHGYPIEVYDNIQTEDGYLLTMHRIPHGRNNQDLKNKPTLFIMHGVLASSADMLVSGPKRALAYYFADLGYDVFLGNARGNTYSKKHISLETNSKEFWDFSFKEIGLYDLPAMLDKSLEIANSTQLYYIGHSQGTTAFFTMLTMKPEYNEKIKLMVAMSPVVYMKNINNPTLKFFSKLVLLGELLGNLVGLHELFPHNDILPDLGQVICEDGHPLNQICLIFIEDMIGESNEHAKEYVPLILAHYPAGSSTKQFFHYAQEINSGKYQDYDNGPIINYIKYKNIKAPEFNLSMVRADIALFYSNEDNLASETDVLHLQESLPNVVKIEMFDGFKHGDYVWSINARNDVYPKIAKLIEEKEIECKKQKIV